MLLIARDSIILRILINFISSGLFYYFTVDIRLTRPSFSGLLLLPFVKCVLDLVYSELTSPCYTVDNPVTEISLAETYTIY